MSKTNWANVPHLDRLHVECQANDIIFRDSATGEAVFIREARRVLEGRSVSVSSGEVIARRDAQHFVRGEGLTERDVWHYVTSRHCSVLRAGLTVHRSAFSSTPHPFELRPRPGFEEVFYFCVNPPSGKVLLEGQGMWADGERIDTAWPVRDDQFACIPMGHHRVVALPMDDGSIPQVLYWWCYLCLRPEWEKDR